MRILGLPKNIIVFKEQKLEKEILKLRCWHTGLVLAILLTWLSSSHTVVTMECQKTPPAKIYLNLDNGPTLVNYGNLLSPLDSRRTCCFRLLDVIYNPYAYRTFSLLEMHQGFRGCVRFPPYRTRGDVYCLIRTCAEFCSVRKNACPRRSLVWEIFAKTNKCRFRTCARL